MKKIFFYLLFFILFSSCSFVSNENYSNIELNIYTEGDLINEIQKTENSIYASLEYFYSTNLLNSFINLYNNNKTINIVLDNNTNFKNFDISNVSVSYRNTKGTMSSHFFIIDNKKLIIFSSSYFETFFPVIIIKNNEEIINNFLTEFENLFNNTNKLEINFLKEFQIDGNKVEVYFLPQNDIKYINSSFSYIKNNIECYFDYFNNETLQKILYTISISGITNKYIFGNNQLNFISNNFFLLITNKIILNKRLNFNLIFIDIFTENQKCIFLNTKLDNDKIFKYNDGIIIVIKGNIVSNFYNNFITNIYNISDELINPNFISLKEALFTNIIISEINWMGVIKNNGESISDGEFIEIKNLLNNYVDLSFYKLIISNKSGYNFIYSFPEASLIPPNGFFVIVRKKGIYSNYNILWEDFFIDNNGFFITLLDRKNNIIDYAGNLSNVLAGTVYNPRRTMVRKLNPLGLGNIQSSWFNATTKYNLYKDYISSNFANPFYDDNFNIEIIDYWSNYYASAYGKSGDELKAALHNIIKGHTVLPYTDVGKDTWKALKDVDEDPENPNNVILIYTGESVPKDQITGNWNREHVWSKSHGFPNEYQPPYTDIHHLRPCNSLLNSYRGNNDFAEGGVYVLNTECKYVKDVSFEPRDQDKGDVARMMFYMAVRYEGDAPNEPDLELTNFIPTPVSVSPHTNGLFGLLSNLIMWHLNDPPDERERIRNNKIYSNWQGNRNPFIDHPEWVTNIWKLE